MTSPANDQAALGALPEWNLADLYASPEDPKFAADMKSGEELAKAFAEAYRGKLASLSGEALAGALKQAAAKRGIKLVNVKYRNTHTGETWTGRGVRVKQLCKPGESVCKQEHLWQVGRYDPAPAPGGDRPYCSWAVPIGPIAPTGTNADL
jgi:hypothetical protein